MLFTKATEYALLSLIVISQKETPQDVDTLAKKLNISKSFLAKILQNLAKEGILTSFKGAHGGFLLSPNAKEVSIRQILECAEKRQVNICECSQSHNDCPSQKAHDCRIWPFLNKLQVQINDLLDSLTLEDIIKG